MFEQVNDLHSALNAAEMVVRLPESVAKIQRFVRKAAAEGRSVALCGGRHAMGGQQFRQRGELLDLRRLKRILHVDEERGLVTTEAGIQWPELISGVVEAQAPTARWGVRQKQTGADALSLGGALAANVHGRGFRMGPIVEDVEAFRIVCADGEVRRCSRDENSELFALAIGGYGLFGVIVEVTLRLAPRRTLRRVVRVIDIEEADPAARRRIEEGFLYGDFQFNIDPASPEFLTAGVFSAYCPVAGDPEPPKEQKRIAREDWLQLLTLAHSDKGEGFRKYAQFYVGTDGQLYKSDTHQLSEYLEGYHAEIERTLGSHVRGSEMITELYVPPPRLIEFLHSAAEMLVERQASVIYGTIRLIMSDETTVLAWARERFACIIFNLHVDHTPAAIECAAETFRDLIDLAIRLGGSYYLTYHRWATAEQFAACYPRVREFFAAKRRLDPQGVFQSDWFRHYAPHFS
ncbi:MAG: hypothetical protein QOD99_3064 [Chthoniobacter sp.]|jgi:FAD/FMN-containing dehydrogenase|nr:hypothetical protein [Chthoniobacter sp.]